MEAAQSSAVRHETLAFWTTSSVAERVAGRQTSTQAVLRQAICSFSVFFLAFGDTARAA